MARLFFKAGILFILIVLFGCGGQKVSTTEDHGQNAIIEQKELIRKHVTDPEKRSELLKIVAELEIESGIFFTYYDKHIENVRELSSNYQTSRADFQLMVEDFNKHYERYLIMLVNKREEMRLNNNTDEWKKIMNRETSFQAM